MENTSHGRQIRDTGGQLHVLFLTTQPLTSGSHFNWNTEILEALASRGIHSSARSFLHDSAELTPQYIAETYTHVCFLLLGEYPPYHNSLVQQLRHTLPAARSINPRLRILNGPRMAMWNSDKSYLRDLKDVGFLIPDTTVLSARQPVDFVKFALNTQTHGNPIVVKPSISASGKNTHLISRPTELTDSDEHFLRSLLDLMQNGQHQSELHQTTIKTPTHPQSDGDPDDNEGNYGSVMLQEYVPQIVNGEYSLCYIGGAVRYTVLKRPQPGGWQVGSEYGGTFQPIPDAAVPPDAVRTSHKLCEWIQERFDGEELAYARIDGVCRDDGSFIIMEVELLEPSLFMFEPKVSGTCFEALSDIMA